MRDLYVLWKKLHATVQNYNSALILFVVQEPGVTHYEKEQESHTKILKLQMMIYMSVSCN